VASSSNAAAAAARTRGRSGRFRQVTNILGFFDCDSKPRSATISTKVHGLSVVVGGLKLP